MMHLKNPFAGVPNPLSFSFLFDLRGARGFSTRFGEWFVFWVLRRGEHLRRRFLLFLLLQRPVFPS